MPKHENEFAITTLSKKNMIPSSEESFFQKLEKNYHYQFVKKLHRGGMGDLFLIRDCSCNRFLTLKKIREDHAHSPSVRKLFIDEVQIMSHLSYPGILPVFYFSDLENQPFYTMPYIEGDTLSTQIIRQQMLFFQGELKSSEETLPFLTGLKIVLEVCSIMQYAHRYGVIHCDIKPENILYSRKKGIFILDWGISQMGDREEPFQERETLKGTPFCMAPELFLWGHSGTNSDIFSLGVLLYQICFFSHPFLSRKGDAPQIREQLHREYLLFPTEITQKRNIPQELLSIIQTCIYPSPSQRYEQIDLLRRELEYFFPHQERWIDREKTPARQFSSSSGFPLKEMTSMDLIDNGTFTFSLSLKKGTEGIEIELYPAKRSQWNLLFTHYSIFLGTREQPGLYIYQRGQCIEREPTFFLQINRVYKISIEILENRFSFFLDSRCYSSRNLFLSPPYYSLKIFSPKETILSFRGACLLHAHSSCQKSSLYSGHLLSHRGHYKEALEEYREQIPLWQNREKRQRALLHAMLSVLQQNTALLNKEFVEREWDALFHFYSKEGVPPFFSQIKALFLLQIGREWAEELAYLRFLLFRYSRQPVPLSLLQNYLIDRLFHLSREDATSIHFVLSLILEHIPDYAHSPPLYRRVLSLLILFPPPLLPIHRLPIEQNREEGRGELFYKLSLSLHQADWIHFHLLRAVSPTAIRNALCFLLYLNQWEPAENGFREKENSLSARERRFFILLFEREFTKLFPPLFSLYRADLCSLFFVIFSFLLGHFLLTGCEELVFLYLEEIQRELPQLSCAMQGEWDLWKSWAHIQRGEWEQLEQILTQYPLFLHRKTLFVLFHGCLQYKKEPALYSESHLQTFCSSLALWKTTQNSPLSFWEREQLAHQRALVLLALEEHKAYSAYEKERTLIPLCILPPHSKRI